MRGVLRNMKKKSNIQLSVLFTTSLMLPLAALSARGVIKAENNGPMRPVAPASVAKPNQAKPSQAKPRSVQSSHSNLNESVIPRLATTLISQLDQARDDILTNQSSTSSLKQAITAVSTKVSAATGPLETQVNAMRDSVKSSEASVESAIAAVIGTPPSVGAPPTGGLIGSDGINIDAESTIYDKLENVGKRVKLLFDPDPAGANDSLVSALDDAANRIGTGIALLGLDNLLNALGTKLDNNYDPNGNMVKDINLAAEEVRRAIGYFFGNSIRDAAVIVANRIGSSNVINNSVDAVMGNPAASPPTYGIIGSDAPNGGAVDAEPDIHGKLNQIRQDIDPSKATLNEAIAALNSGFGYQTP